MQTPLRSSRRGCGSGRRCIEGIVADLSTGGSIHLTQLALHLGQEFIKAVFADDLAELGAVILHQADVIDQHIENNRLAVFDNRAELNGRLCNFRFSA